MNQFEGGGGGGGGAGLTHWVIVIWHGMDYMHACVAFDVINRWVLTILCDDDDNLYYSGAMA